MRERKSKKNTLIVIAVVAALAAVALWQFYVFVSFKNAVGVVDVQGGAMHLWLAFGIGVAACITAFLGASFFLRYDRNDELHITSPPQRHEPVL
jgi:type VI protein secretion system component VasF